MLRSDASSNKSTVIGVDVGGTKIAAALVNKTGDLHGYLIRRTNILSPQATLDSIARTILDLLKQENFPRDEIRGVGLGIPGLVDPQKGIGIASVNLNWENVFVRDEIQKRVGIPCVIENDVKAAALGELRYGASKGIKNLVYLNIGTGVAAAIILDGKVYRGQNDMAGEIGHAVVDIHGPKCKCGGQGCLEAIVSGPAIISRLTRKIELGQDSIFATQITNTSKITVEEIYEAASEGDRAALETVREVSRYLAIAIQYLALAYDPHRIVLGGGVVYSTPLFFEHLLQAITQLSQESWVSRHLLTPNFITVTQLGSNIGVLGAAALVP